MVRKGLVALLVVAALAVTYLLWLHMRPGPDGMTREEPAELARMRSDIDGLRREQVATRNLALLAATRSDSKGAVRQPEGDGGAIARENAPAEQRLPPTPQEARDQLELRFSREGRDPAWSDGDGV